MGEALDGLVDGLVGRIDEVIAHHQGRVAPPVPRVDAGHALDGPDGRSGHPGCDVVVEASTIDNLVNPGRKDPDDEREGSEH